VGTAAVRAGVTDKVRRLSESCEIPVVTSYPALGVLPHDHPMNYGAITGYMDGVLDYDAQEAIFGPVDLLITVGYDYAEDLRPPMWTRGVPKRIVRIASTPNLVPEVFRPDVDVVSPLWEALTGLKEALIGTVRKGGHDIRGLRQRVADVPADRTEHPGGLLASQVVACVNRVLDGGVFVTDVGLYRHFAVVFSQVDEPNRFLTSDGCATFGFGLPAAMAARIAHPEKPVVLVCGDGGFHSNSQDLETAVRLGLPIVIVLLKNGRNELIRFYQLMGRQQTNARAVEFGPVDFAALARAQGCEGFQVDRLADLEPALRRALALDHPVLIEVPVLYPDLEARHINVSEVS
jgi:acetolactate synthase-1/2/3 large subunit/N2-(2-carboxyethyl)arginine synthase